MTSPRFTFVFAALSITTLAAFGQNPVTADSPLQVRYAANLGAGDSVVNITNTGASGGNICVNVYTFSPDEQLISCCTCVVTPNGLVNLSARNDLISNTLTPAVPGSIVIKLYATTGRTCNAATPGNPAVGLAAWGTTIHATPGSAAFSVTETAFTPASPGRVENEEVSISQELSAELARISALCGFIQSNGSGYGICRSCRLGAVGAARQ